MCLYVIFNNRRSEHRTPENVWDGKENSMLITITQIAQKLFGKQINKPT